MGNRRIMDVADGTSLTDAVTVSQLRNHIPTQLTDENAADGNIYGIKLRNDQVELYRGTAAAPDQYLNIFGSSGSNGVIMETNKRSFFLETIDDASEINTYRRLKVGSVNETNVPSFRIQQTYIPGTGLKYTRLSTRVTTGNDTAVMLYADTTGSNSYVREKIQLTKNAGYQADLDVVSVTGINDHSILAKRQCDSLYLSRSEKQNAIADGNFKMQIYNSGSVQIQYDVDINERLSLSTQSITADGALLSLQNRGS